MPLAIANLGSFFSSSFFLVRPDLHSRQSSTLGLRLRLSDWLYTSLLLGDRRQPSNFFVSFGSNGAENLYSSLSLSGTESPLKSSLYFANAVRPNSTESLFLSSASQTMHTLPCRVPRFFSRTKISSMSLFNSSLISMFPWTRMTMLIKIARHTIPKAILLCSMSSSRQPSFF